MPKRLTDRQLQQMLDEPLPSEDTGIYGDPYSEPEEDLLIEQPDGSSACLNWELKGRGFQIFNPNKK
jgi:hypothetical protein